MESVSYSQRTANRLMQLFEEYGDKLFASGDDSGRSNSSAPTNLTYYQAILLLGIPEDEREGFILQHDVKNMTTRELDQALKERKQTALEKEQAQVTPMSNNRGGIEIEYRTVKKTTNQKAGRKLQPPKHLLQSMKNDAPLAAKLSPIHSRSCWNAFVGKRIAHYRKERNLTQVN